MLRWFLFLFGICGLIGVRVVEEQAFYDPFIDFFHQASKGAVFPDFEWGKLTLSHFFRFFLNLFFSAIIVQALFSNKKWTVQAVVLIGIVFLITFPIYLYCVSTKFEIGYLFSFYIRRFVIQPLILLLIIPLFYYRRAMEKQSEND